MDQLVSTSTSREPWNKGKLVGQKAPLKLKDIWAIRVRLQISNRVRDLALFNLAIDSKLRACDLVKLRVRDVSHGGRVSARAIVMQQKTHRPVQFEITEVTRDSVAAWITLACLRAEDCLFPSRVRASPHLDATVRKGLGLMGTRDRPGSGGLRHPQYAAHEGGADLSTDQEPSGSSTIAWPLQAGKHSPLPRHRGG